MRSPLLYDKPTLGQLYFKVAYESYKVAQAHGKAPPGYGMAYYVEDALDRYNVDFLYPFDTSIVEIVDRLGAPMAASPTRTTKEASPAASERVGGRPSSAHGRRKRTSVSARGKCPKGHYWSYKEKKCLKSKF